MSQGPVDPKPLPLVVQWRQGFLSELGPSKGWTRAVLLYLSTAMRADGGQCFPSHDTIAGALGVSIRTVERAIADAQEEGWVQAILRRGRAPTAKRRSGGRHYQYFPAFSPDYLMSQSREVDGEKRQAPERNGGPPPVRESRRQAPPDSQSQRPVRESQPPDSQSQRPVRESAYLVSTGLVPGYDQSAHAREGVSLSTEEPPASWEEPSEFMNPKVLFDLMDDHARRWASGKLGASPTAPIMTPRDLGYLQAADLRRLRFHVACTRGVLS